VGSRESFRKYFTIEQLDIFIETLLRETTKIKFEGLGTEKYKNFILDIKDIAIYQTFLKSSGDYLVTGNLKHFKIKQALNPRQFLDMLLKI
jgi:hypothetical protein